MILLDTHALLWFLNDDDKMPVQLRELIEDDAAVYQVKISMQQKPYRSSIMRTFGAAVTGSPSMSMVVTCLMPEVEMV